MNTAGGNTTAKGKSGDCRCKQSKQESGAPKDRPPITDQTLVPKYYYKTVAKAGVFL